MSEIVERCAKALVQSASETWSGGSMPWDSLPEVNRDIARANARAVIEAMLDPTVAMVRAGQNAGDAAMVWRFMIDEALK